MPPRMVIEKSLEKRFIRCLRRGGNREIGGILLGEQLQVNVFRVVDFSTDEVTGGRAHFCRSIEYHNEVLDTFFDQTGHDYSRYNYLGEWHSHPSFPVHPSYQDKISMLDLVDGERDIDFAALLIARLDYYFSLKLSATLFSRGGMVENFELGRS